MRIESYRNKSRNNLKSVTQDEIDTMVDSFVRKEREEYQAPFLADRVMSKIAATGNIHASSKITINRLIRPLVISASMAAAVSLGILIGSLYPSKSDPLPVEISLIDDIEIESLNYLSFE